MKRIEILKTIELMNTLKLNFIMNMSNEEFERRYQKSFIEKNLRAGTGASSSFTCGFFRCQDCILSDPNETICTVKISLSEISHKYIIEEIREIVDLIWSLKNNELN